MLIIIENLNLLIKINYKYDLEQRTLSLDEAESLYYKHYIGVSYV